jgi:hypothetical protein
MQEVTIILDGKEEHLKLGQVLPDSEGRIIKEMYTHFDELIIVTKPPPAQGSNYSIPITQIVK